MSELTLADHAEAWQAERGLTVPPRDTPEWKAMYEEWAHYAFDNLGNATEPEFSATLDTPSGTQRVTISREYAIDLANQFNRVMLPSVIFIGDVPCEGSYASDIVTAALDHYGVDHE